MTSQSNSQPPSRAQLVSWLNRTLQANLSKIQQLGNGCLYLQLLDLAFPQAKIPLSKLNWKAELELDNIQNLKLVTTWMDRLGIGKSLDVEKVARCKYQDNLEMAQWFKKFVEGTVTAERMRNYNAMERRSGVQAAFLKSEKGEKKFQKKAIGKVDSGQTEKMPLKTFLPKDEMEIEKKLEKIDRILHHDKSNPDNKFDRIKEIILSGKSEPSYCKIHSDENKRQENSNLNSANCRSQEQNAATISNFASINKGDMSFEGESLLNHYTGTRDAQDNGSAGRSLLDIQPCTQEKGHRARSHPNTEVGYDDEQLLEPVNHASRNSNAI